MQLIAFFKNSKYIILVLLFSMMNELIKFKIRASNPSSKKTGLKECMLMASNVINFIFLFLFIFAFIIYYSFLVHY